MNSAEKNKLCQDVTKDVHEKFEKHIFGSGPPHFDTGMGLPNISPGVSSLVMAAVDLMVTIGGSAISQLVIADRDKIKTVVSDKTIQFLQGLLSDLQVPTGRPAGSNLPDPHAVARQAQPQGQQRAPQAEAPRTSGGPAGPFGTTGPVQTNDPFPNKFGEANRAVGGPSVPPQDFEGPAPKAPQGQNPLG